jgi:two-component system, OmpR family, phosphate regulon sensor histidine kinase PhoR
MPRQTGISMRWLLGLAFAAIAALTALSVAQVFSARAEAALRDRGEELAIGQSVSAASAASQALRRGVLEDAATVIAERRRFSLWAFSADGAPLTGAMSRGLVLDSVPGGTVALQAALDGRRYVKSLNGGKDFLVALRTHDPEGALVTYTRRPELRAELGIVRAEIVRAALLSVGIGAVVGLLIAALITSRLSRIARAAAAIEAGAFDGEVLQPRFNDELGALARSIDRMRLRLRDSFGRIEGERDRLRQLLEGLHEGVVAVDPELRVAFANSAARPLLGGVELDEGGPLPEPWDDFPLREFAARLFDGGSTVRQARVLAGERAYAVSGIPARTGAADAILVVADISERERRERAEREFVANAAHELGTPLTAISTSLEVLQSGAKNDVAERDRFLALIERQTGRLGRLRRALLALARAQTRQQALQLEPIELRPLFERIAAEAVEAAGDVELAVDAAAGFAVLAHRDLLEQVIVNLVENALRHARPSRVVLAGRPLSAGIAAVEVRDDGRGIAVAERERLFDRFYRGDGEGFGLGLAIVREAVRAVGGRIEVGPAPAGGTVVRIMLAEAGIAVA